MQIRSLRMKLMLFVTALVVLPGAIYGLIAVRRSQADLERIVTQRLATEARTAADALAVALRLERDRLRSMARQDVMREIRVADVDKRIASFLTTTRSGCHACRDASVLATDDRIVASSEPILLGATMAVPDGVDAIAGPEGKPPVLRLATDIPDPEHPATRLGRLVVRYDWGVLQEAGTRVRERIGTSDVPGSICIVDATGHVLGGTPGCEGSRDHTTPASMLVGEAAFTDDLPPWRVRAMESRREAFAPIRRTAAMLATVLIATLALALGLALWAARKVTEPLAALTQAVGRVGRPGDAIEPVVVRSRDEVGVLADAFNRMRVDLRRAEREVIDAAKFAFVGELAAGVAHEVRTPLGVMRSATQLIERSLRTEDPRVTELVGMLRDEVDRVESVVSGLLQLARPRACRPEPLDVAPVLRRAATFIESQAGEKQITVRCDLDGATPVALADPDLLYQVVLNLLVNALHVLQIGGHITLAWAPPQPEAVGFVVRDDGPGMPEEVRARVFEPFFTCREGGAGLGLTFVRRVMDEHRGRIELESTPGAGTTFAVYLPRPEGVA